MIYSENDERRKVVDNLMNLILKKYFAEFGAILKELRLFKLRGRTCPATGKTRLKMKI